jgi:hypothetical protein
MTHERSNFGLITQGHAPKPQTQAEILSHKTPIGLVTCARFAGDPDLLSLAISYQTACIQLDRDTDSVTRAALAKDRTALEQRLAAIWTETALARRK